MGGRTEHIDTLYSILADEIAKHPTAYWRQRLDEADIPNASMKEPTDLVRDPYLETIGFLRRAEHPTEGRTLSLGFPLAFGGAGEESWRPPPPLGEHTHEKLGRASCRERVGQYV